MAYERDRDRATRGIGAIASLDHVSPSERYRQRSIGRATQQRDRRMVALSMGAFGSDHRHTPAPPGVVQGPVPKSTSSGASISTRDHRTGAPSTPQPGAPPPAAAPGTYPSQPTAPSSPVPTTPPTPAPSPTAPSTTITVSGGAGGTSTTSGSGSGGGSATSAPVPVPVDTTQLPDLPDATATDNTKTLMIAGGVAAAALAAYLIFRKRPS